jgi:hypothetical protein
MIRLLVFLVTGFWLDKAQFRVTRKCTTTEPDWCGGLASPLCWSGRCREHCSDTCQCESVDLTLEEARLVRKHREGRKALLEAVEETDAT